MFGSAHFMKRETSFSDLIINSICFLTLAASLFLLYVYTRFLQGVDHVSAIELMLNRFWSPFFVRQRVPERIQWFRNYRIATTVVSALLIFAIWKRSLLTDKFQDADLVLIILYFVNLVIDVYVVLCIHSLYKKFEEETLPIKNCPAVLKRLQVN